MYGIFQRLHDVRDHPVLVLMLLVSEEEVMDVRRMPKRVHSRDLGRKERNKSDSLA